MALDARPGLPPPVERFFETLLVADASGSTWLPQLLAATPGGTDKLGELVAAPGWLVTPLAVRGASGRLACFEYPAVPPRNLLRWYIDHPDRLTWPDGEPQSDATVRLRRALIDDEPPGARQRAQDRARDLLAASAGLTRDWWRFEEIDRLDCVLITGRLVVAVSARGPDSLAPATPWYPSRPRLVRDLEAARQISTGRRWASLLLSEQPVAGAGEADLARSVAAAAPHLDEEGHRELLGAYLGNITWAQASAAVGVPLAPAGGALTGDAR